MENFARKTFRTGESLIAYSSGMPPEECGFLCPNGKGNGALMRVLLLALWHNGTDQELFRLCGGLSVKCLYDYEM